MASSSQAWEELVRSSRLVENGEDVEKEEEDNEEEDGSGAVCKVTNPF